MKKRIYYLDKIKVLLCILVVCLHTAVAYGAAGLWFYNEKNNNIVECAILTMFTAICQSFFMGLFFFISAYFTPASYNKKGSKKFFVDKLKRLGVPLLIFYFFLHSFTNWIVYYFKEGKKVSFIDFWYDFHSFGQGPLWFVQALILFNLGYIIVRKIKKNTIKVTHVTNSIIIKLILVIAAASFVVRIFIPTGIEICGMQFGYFSQYIVLFICGCIAYNNKLLETIDKKLANKWFVAGLVSIPLMPIVLYLGGAVNNIQVFFGSLSWQSLAYSLWEPVMCMGISLKLITLYRDKYDYKSTITSRLAKCTYPIFIIHAPINVAIECLLMNVKIDLFIKFIITASCTFLIAFVLSELYYKLKEMIFK